ncbi:MAG: ATP-dependent DNA ligase, partial [Acidimicrobiia bacterium]
MFPDDGITKGEVYAYYTEVAQRMLPYLSGRALTVERYPKGIA